MGETNCQGTLEEDCFHVDRLPTTRVLVAVVWGNCFYQTAVCQQHEVSSLIGASSWF
jgi:hypothetical protein